MTRSITIIQRTRVLEMLEQGTPREVIAQTVGVTPGQVSAVAAHKKMGTYASEPPTTTTHLPEDGNFPTGPRLVRTNEQAKHPNTEPAAGAILVGIDVSDGSPIYWNPTAAASANPHVLILGESGYGKTYTTSCLLAELAQSQVSSVVFDYGQGFSSASSPSLFRERARAVDFELNRDGIAINPLEIFSVDLHGPATVAQRVADTFTRVYPRIGVQQHAVIRQAVLEVLSDHGIKQFDRTTWNLRAPHFRNLERKLATLADDVGASNRRVALAAASHISTLFVFDTFRSSGRTLGWDDLLNRPQTWVLQLGGLESSVERAVTEFLLWNLIRFVEARGPGPLRCFVVLDEAHKMSFAPGSPVEKLLREGRKFGLGVILASQQPEDFSPVAFANTATKLIFQVSDDRGVISRLLYRKTRNREVGAYASEVITKLPRGSAYLVTENTGRVVTITSFEDRLARWRQLE